jgi:hypothetical protein
VELVQANKHLTAANKGLTGQVRNLLLQFACHDTVDLPLNGMIDNLTMQVKTQQDFSQTASEERNDLKHSVITLKQD